MSENQNEGQVAADGPAPVEVMDKAPPISAELRAKIMADPNVAKVAASLGTPIEEFINQIGFFYNNPDTQPALAIASDEDIKKLTGNDPPTFEQIEANVKASAEAWAAGQAPSGYDAPKKNTVEMPASGGEQVKPTNADPKLQDAIKKARFPSKG